MDFAGTLKTRPMERYQKMNQLGEGTYGIVYKAKDKLTDEVRDLSSFLLRSWHLRRFVLSMKKTEYHQLQFEK